MRRLVILNPIARQGRALGLKDLLYELLGVGAQELVVEVTADRGHATALAAKALDEGFEHIVSVGGDGTANEVANGFFDGPRLRNPQARLSLLLQGTGCDLGRAFGLGPGLEEQIARIHWNRAWPIDLIRVSFADQAGQQTYRYALNVTGFGLSGAVDRRMEAYDRGHSRASGRLAFLKTTVQTYLDYEKPWVWLSLDGGVPLELRALSVAVANGPCFGGGMWIAPEAKNDDGLMDVVVVGDLSWSEVAWKFPKIYSGTHLGEPNIFHYRAKTLDAWAEPNAWLDLDGESPGRLPARFEILPNALTLQI